MKNVELLWTTFTILTARFSSGEVFSSAENMKEVFALERNLDSVLNIFRKQLEGNLRNIDNYLTVSNFIYVKSILMNMLVHPSPRITEQIKFRSTKKRSG